MVPSLLPQASFDATFAEHERDAFDDLEDELDIDALVDALFPASLTGPG